MNDKKISDVFRIIKKYIRRDSKSWTEYERGKIIIQLEDLEPYQYQFLINKLAAWVGV